jgi:hypothetical protein
MNRIALPLAAAALAVPAHAEVQVAAQGPVVELSVTETVNARPDLAEVSAGVTTDAPTAVEAMRLNAAEMTRVIQRIRALGIDADDVQTSGINLGARYDYDQGTQRQVFRGYQASNRVSVTLREVDEVGGVLDALVAAGATDIGGPNFSLENDAAAKAQARQAAVRKAEEMARQYAQWSGYTGVRVLKISEALYRNPPMPMLRMEAAADAAGSRTPVAPGVVGSSVTVAVTYEMTR